MTPLWSQEELLDWPAWVAQQLRGKANMVHRVVQGAAESQGMPGAINGTDGFAPGVHPLTHCPSYLMTSRGKRTRPGRVAASSTAEQPGHCATQDSLEAGRPVLAR